MNILDFTYEKLYKMPLGRLKELGIPKEFTRELISNQENNRKLELYNFRIVFSGDLPQIKDKTLRKEFKAEFEKLLKSKNHELIKQKYGLLVGRYKREDEVLMFFMQPDSEIRKASIKELVRDVVAFKNDDRKVTLYQIVVSFPKDAEKISDLGTRANFEEEYKKLRQNKNPFLILEKYAELFNAYKRLSESVKDEI